ncbi:hypothetical protein [Sediminibacillus massiliensis]|uniref:hypothetical protein n=1 Tax=Sediminibacillus massiliensis TaxID=1926277 RepID=UPI0015C3DD15|nr:hypothetical protein [Sediminibacillus massiliensis]
MLTVKMKVQTAYHGELLREGKEYEVDDSTAQRWHSSNIAAIIEEEQSEEKNRK